jgi:hypothetical protein
VTTTPMRNCRFAIVWDDEVQSHVYRSGIDAVIAKQPVEVVRLPNLRCCSRVAFGVGQHMALFF